MDTRKSEEGEYTDIDPINESGSVSNEAGEYTDSEIPGETTEHAEHLAHLADGDGTDHAAAPDLDRPL